MNLTVMKLCPMLKQAGETKPKKLTTPRGEISPFNTSGITDKWGVKVVTHHGHSRCTCVHEEQRAQSKRGGSSPCSCVPPGALGGIACLPALISSLWMSSLCSFMKSCSAPESHVAFAGVDTSLLWRPWVEVAWLIKAWLALWYFYSPDLFLCTFRLLINIQKPLISSCNHLGYGIEFNTLTLGNPLFSTNVFFVKLAYIRLTYITLQV